MKAKTLRELGLPANHEERMKYMEGYGIGSQLFEDTVGIIDGKIYHNGYVYLYPNQITPRISNILYDEMVANELGGDPGYFGCTKNCEQDWWDDFHEKIWKKVRKNLWKQGFYGDKPMKDCV